MARVAQWIEAHNPDHDIVLWVIIWTTANIGLIALIMWLVSST